MAEAARKRSAPETLLVSEDVLVRLKADILDGRFAPGTKLPFAQLQRDYGAGIGTLREALSALRSEGLVELDAGRGFRVAPVSAADLREVSALHIEFERRAVAESVRCGDEAWELAAAVSPICIGASGNSPCGDWFSFLVSHGEHVFAGPHRDKPMAGLPSFRVDGAPKYCTAWIPLSNATPENSCLYFLPASRDPGYLVEGDALREALPSPASFGNIVAQPCSAGSLLVFSHRLLHWGSTAEPHAPPRIAMSFAVADATFEDGPYFDAARFLPFPPLALRVALRAGQAIAYDAQSPLSRAQLALDNRVFMAGAAFFSAAYVAKIRAAAQQIKFNMGQRRVRRP